MNMIACENNSYIIANDFPKVREIISACVPMATAIHYLVGREVCGAIEKIGNASNG